jgi:hypothetical protein
MKSLTLILIITFLPSFHAFESEIKASLDVLKKQKRIINEIKNTSSAPNDEALAIVFPEMIRWSAFKDFIETTALETMYVSNGKSTVDFSIGYFQMKPSFIEDLENYIAQHPSVQSLDFIVLKDKTAKECRAERIKRLKDWAWQIRYAHVYWIVAHDIFKNKTFKTPSERVCFYATAYNYGFLKPIEDIEKWQAKVAFPYGLQYKGTQVAYSDLSIEFLDKYAKGF